MTDYPRMNMKSSIFVELVNRIKELEEENEQLKKWCEEFNALEVMKENKRLKENIHSMLFTDDVVQERYDKVLKENTKLKTENKWYSEQLNEAVKEINKLKNLLNECKSILERRCYIEIDLSLDDFIKQIEEVLNEEK